MSSFECLMIIYTSNCMIIEWRQGKIQTPSLDNDYLYANATVQYTNNTYSIRRMLV